MKAYDNSNSGAAFPDDENGSTFSGPFTFGKDTGKPNSRVVVDLKQSCMTIVQTQDSGTVISLAYGEIEGNPNFEFDVPEGQTRKPLGTFSCDGLNLTLWVQTDKDGVNYLQLNSRKQHKVGKEAFVLGSKHDDNGEEAAA